MVKATRARPASFRYTYDREAGAASVVAMAASERGDLVLGTVAGEVEVLRIPPTPLFGLAPWTTPSVEAQRVMSQTTSPDGAPVTDLAVALTTAGGAVVVATHLDGTVAALPAVPGATPILTTAGSAPLLVDAAFTAEQQLAVAVATEEEVLLWWPEHDRTLRRPLDTPASCLTLLAGPGTRPGVVVGNRPGFAVYSEEDGRLEWIVDHLVDGGIGDVAAWRWPDGAFRLATVPADGPPGVTIWPLAPSSWESPGGRFHPLAGDGGGVARLLHTRDLLAVVHQSGAIELLPLAASGHQRLPADDSFELAALLRSPDGRPSLATVSDGGRVVLQELDLQRQPGDELLTLNNDTATGSVDLLDFGAYARPLSIVISAEETDTPLVIGIDGQWGQGKTRLGHMVDAELPTEGHQMAGELACRSIWFNAWMHSDADDLATAIAASVAVGVQPLRPWWRRLVSPAPGRAFGGLRRYGRIVAVAVAVLVGAALVVRPDWLEEAYSATGVDGGGALFSLGGLSVTLGLLRLVGLVRDQVGGVINAFLTRAGSVVEAGRVWEVREDLGHRIADATRPIPDPLHPSRVPLFDRLRAWALRQRSGVLRNVVRRPVAALLDVRPARRVVLFVDDLDRCNSARSVEACEAISQLLDHRGLVTVVMVDLEALATHAEVQFTALAERIHPDRKGAGWGRRFLDKIFQFEFTIPAHRSAALSTLLKSSLDARAPLHLKPEPETAAGLPPAAGGLATVGPPQLNAPTSVDPILDYLPGYGLGTRQRLDAMLAASQPPPPPDHSTLSVEWFWLFVLIPTLYVINEVDPWWGKVLVGVAAFLVGAAWAWRDTKRKMERDVRTADLRYVSPMGSATSTLGRSAVAMGSSPPEGTATADPDAAAPPPGVPITRREAVKMVLEEGDHLDLAYREASRWLDGTTPRTAKRLANRLLFTTAVATERNLLWTDSALDGRVIGKWVTLVERWPGLAVAIRRDPSVLTELEQSAGGPDPKAFSAAVGRRAPNVADLDVLRRLLSSPPGLSGHARAFAHLAQ